MELYSVCNSSFTSESWDKNHAHACVFAFLGHFRYNLSGWMKWAQNSDSKTHVKRQNLTSGTEIRRQLLKYLFLETPCMYSPNVYFK